MGSSTTRSSAMGSSATRTLPSTGTGTRRGWHCQTLPSLPGCWPLPSNERPQAHAFGGTCGGSWRHSIIPCQPLLLLPTCPCPKSFLELQEHAHQPAEWGALIRDVQASHPTAADGQTSRVPMSVRVKEFPSTTVFFHYLLHGEAAGGNKEKASPLRD